MRHNSLLFQSSRLAEADSLLDFQFVRKKRYVVKMVLEVRIKWVYSLFTNTLCKLQVHI